MFVVIAKNFDVRHFLKGQHWGIERNRTIHVGNDHSRGNNAFDLTGGCKLLSSRCLPRKNQQQQEIYGDLKLWERRGSRRAVFHWNSFPHVPSATQFTGLTDSISPKNPSASVGWM